LTPDTFFTNNLPFNRIISSHFSARFLLNFLEATKKELFPMVVKYQA